MIHRSVNEPTCAVPPLILCMLTPLPLSLPPLCGSFVSSEVRATRLLAEVANRAQHGGADSERRGVQLHTLGSAPLGVMGLFKVIPLQKTTFFLNSPKLRQQKPLSLPPSLSPSFSLPLFLPPSCAHSTSSCRRAFVLTSTKVKNKTKHWLHHPLKHYSSQKLDDGMILSTFSHRYSQSQLVLRAVAVSSQYKINIGRVGFWGLFIITFTHSTFSRIPEIPLNIYV